MNRPRHEGPNLKLDLTSDEVVMVMEGLSMIAQSEALMEAFGQHTDHAFNQRLLFLADRMYNLYAEECSKVDLPEGMQRPNLEKKDWYKGLGISNLEE